MMSRRVMPAVIASALGAGCVYQRDEGAVELIRRGEYGAARERVSETQSRDPSDREFLLDRMKLLVLALDDGLPDRAERPADELYEMLRTQGLNEDRTVGSFVFGESGTRIWKGEPFEQALGYTYVGLLDGVKGDWGNVRASSRDSLFLLRDFSRVAPAAASSDPVRARRAVIEASVKDGSGDRPDDLGLPYTPVLSDFELGYVLNAIASRSIGFTSDADEALRSLHAVSARLDGLARRIEGGSYNAVIVGAWGIGPVKVAAGDGGVIASFEPVTPSTDDVLVVETGGETSEWPIVTDVNRLALDVRWNNLEDMRIAKSAIGTSMIIAGTAVAASNDDTASQLAGITFAVAGMLLRASAVVDTRQCEVLPQRFYVALLNLPPEGARVAFSIPGRGAGLVLSGVRGSASGAPVMHYVRIPQDSAPWSTSGLVLYANDSDASPAGADLPYILGGRCVRTPTDRVLADYQRAGNLVGMSLNDLVDLYRDEGIEFADRSPASVTGLHILEGGRWLYTPDPASAAYARLYGAERPAYTPRSERVRVLADQIAGAHAGK